MEEACTLASCSKGYCVHISHMLILCTKKCFSSLRAKCSDYFYIEKTNDNIFCLIKTSPLVRVQIVIKNFKLLFMACLCFSFHLPFKKETKAYGTSIYVSSEK